MEDSEINWKCINATESTENKYDWQIVFNILEKINEKDLHYNATGNIAKFLLDSLHRYGSSNINHIKDIIRRYTIWLGTNYIVSVSPSSVFPLFSSMDSLMKLTKELVDSKCLDHIIYYRDELSELDSMHFALKFSDTEFTACLFKYGMYTLEKIHWREIENSLSLFLNIWLHIHGNRIRTENYREAAYFIIREFLQYISLKHPEFPEKRPKAHIVFILKIIKAIILKLDNEPNVHQYVNCLKLFYRIVPEPYIPGEDVKDMLPLLLKLTDRKEEIIETYLSTYVELFGVENTAMYKPRSLKHLSRCVVRNEIIRNSNTVEKSVKYLDLPKTLKQLLLGEPE